MGLQELVSRIGDIEKLDRITEPMTRTAKKLVPAGPVKDILSGTPLGHPLHPPLTDVPIGCFTAATLLDLLGGRKFEAAVEYQHEPQEWTAVMDAADLPTGGPTMATAGDATILLYRSDGRIYAIGSRCSHAGGPLHEGKIDDDGPCVECPWHGSVFRLDDGSAVHGPASVPQVAYDVRVQDGRVEVRRRG
jgi:nitrite reductase/ring-hydroxylating ferredoxin subunit